MKSIRNLFYPHPVRHRIQQFAGSKAYGNLYHPEANATEDIAQAIQKPPARASTCWCRAAAIGAVGATSSTISSKKTPN
ncbi:MAG: hypothetical protein IPM82_27370 [Saprospiraceae bacterium]|nr:hypothetical protein [Saprospiraceae bacterium]